MDEELAKILANGELDEAGKTQAIKTLVGNSFVPMAKFKEEKENSQTAYNQLKTEYDSFKQSKMTDDEKKAEKERITQENLRNANLKISKMTAENAFAKAGFKEEDYSAILEGIIQEDAEKTKTLAETICTTMLKQKKLAEEGLKDKIVKGTKTPPAGNDNGTSGGDVEKYQTLLQEAQKRNDYVSMATYTRLLQEAQRNEE